jgi:hypothetical protein
MGDAGNDSGDQAHEDQRLLDREREFWTGWIPCGLGICSGEDGHEGSCAEASGWADDMTSASVHTDRITE